MLVRSLVVADVAKTNEILSVKYHAVRFLVVVFEFRF